MKKTLIALALAALPVASMADVILYGQVKGGVEVGFAQKVNGKTADENKKSTTQIVDYGSRIGFKGHEHLNGDLKAIWQVEQDVNIGGVEQGFSTRDSFIGLQGSFGTVKAGYQSTPVRDLNGKLDQWDYSDNVILLAKMMHVVVQLQLAILHQIWVALAQLLMFLHLITTIILVLMVANTMTMQFMVLV